jgi:hypothetical protein
MMKSQNRLKSLRALVVASGLLIGASHIQAQDAPPPGGFDPAQRRQRRLEQLRDTFGVTDDAEWKVISEQIGQIMELRRSIRPTGGPGGFGGPGRPPVRPDDGAAPSGGQNDPNPPGEFRQRPQGTPPFRAELSPEAQELQKAIQAKAPVSELKAKLGQFKEARLKQQAQLERAQESLRQLLTTQQEAIAVINGLL